MGTLGIGQAFLLVGGHMAAVKGYGLFNIHIHSDDIDVHSGAIGYVNKYNTGLIKVVKVKLLLSTSED